MKVIPDPVVAGLAPLTLADPEGSNVRLGDLWRERPAVLVFIRHFGCLFCREQVAELKDVLPELRSLANVVIVGNGEPFHAAAFREDESIEVPLLVDPDLEAYAAAGLRRGIRSSVSLGAVKNAVRALRGGHRQTSVKGDPWQQGGVLVITPDGVLVYHYVSKTAGDHPDPAAIVDAVRAVSD